MTADVTQIENWLLAQPGWVKGRDLCEALGILNDRHLRDDGDVPGLVSEFAISHTRKGYRHYLKATTEEWLRFKHSRRRHGFREFRRISKMQGRRNDDRQGILL
jgi:hypothetical protein